MRQLRTFFCAFSWVASLFALALHLGLKLWGCSACSLVSEMPISGVLAWTGPLILLALTYGQYKNMKWGNYALGLASFGSLTLVAWMINNNLICKMCVLVHAGVFSATLSMIPRPRFIGPLFFSLCIAFTATEGWTKFTVARGLAIFRPRVNEVIPDGKVYVLFSDPECSRCHLIEDQISKLSNPPVILHRWTLLPSSMYRSIRAISMLEMARLSGAKEFELLRMEILRTPAPLVDAALLSAANRVGMGSQAKGWLESPSRAALVAIQADQANTRELNILSLPALGELSPPDVTGTRTMRLVPFSTIGLNPP